MVRFLRASRRVKNRVYKNFQSCISIWDVWLHVLQKIHRQMSWSKQEEKTTKWGVQRKKTKILNKRKRSMLVAFNLNAIIANC